jgi:hypothetical protein
MTPANLTENLLNKLQILPLQKQQHSSDFLLFTAGSDRF